MKYISAQHDMSTLTAEFITEDGTRYLRTGGNPCWRFFNPGNIRPSKTSVCDSLKIGIATTKSGKFMIFPDHDTGWLALKKLLKITYVNFTINKLTAVYSPLEDENSPQQYSTFIIDEANVKGTDCIKNMDDETLERVMEAIKKMEGHYNKQNTQKENTIPTTNIIFSDGNKPIANEKVKVVVDQCTYEWNTNNYGELPTIAHFSDRTNISIFVKNSDGKDESIFSTTAGESSRNILLLKNGQNFIAKTGEHKEGEKSTEDYQVEKGDTLGKIARELHTTVKRLADLNDITNVNVISVGQKIKVPGGMSKPQVAQTQQTPEETQQPVLTGTSDKGFPQANIGNTWQAPWMKIALEQAKLWAGKDESEINDNINYHKKVGVPLPSIVGNSNPWCASFVNYCLVQAKPHYSKSNKPGKALSFSTDIKHFIKIDTPIFGAIAVFARKGGGHVCFVVALSETNNENIIVLGGNQGDKINFMERSLRGLVGFFVPKAYEKTAEDEVKSFTLPKNSAENLNSELNIENNNNKKES